MYLKNYHIHFVGIGGVGMSGIAKLLLELGYSVSGSDIRRSPNTKLIQSLNGTVFYSHQKKNIKNANVVVFSSAINQNNVEIKAAISAKIPVIPRSEMLAELMKQKYSIVVSGTHGKTSTTALIADLLKTGNFHPRIVIGGIIKELNCNALIGSGDYMVAEADESDGSLFRYSPTIAVVTNIDKDHLDFYKDMDNIKRTFHDFIAKIPFYGTAILCLDDKSLQEIIPQINKKIVTYGINSSSDLRASKIIFKDMTSQFTVTYLNKLEDNFTLNMPGIHNVYNALAAIAVGLQLDMPFDIMKTALKKTKGVKRRMELKGKVNGITIVDDYAHHPTEILAALNAAKKSWPDKRKIVLFQPHRYTRTEILFHEFADSFYESDVLIIMPIYAADEKLTRKVESKDLCRAIESTGHRCVLFVNDFEDCLKKLKLILQKEDLLLTLGAGNVYLIGETIIKLLGQNAKKYN